MALEWSWILKRTFSGVTFIVCRKHRASQSEVFDGSKYGKILGMASQMNQFHDPIRQANYLRQSLATDKMRIGLFVGAGCPVSIKIDENAKNKH
jgi:hypothetical protein